MANGEKLPSALGFFQLPKIGLITGNGGKGVFRIFGRDFYSGYCDGDFLCYFITNKMLSIADIIIS
jgi:hypothetical protein